MKPKFLNMAVQAGRIKSKFPESQLIYDQNKLVWESKLRPTALSQVYDIRLIYIKSKHPDVYVLCPKLDRPPGQTKLKHVYNSEKQHLCLYVRRSGEWNSSMAIADTIIPWTSEWLYFHEIWVSTGEWLGGGTEH